MLESDDKLLSVFTRSDRLRPNTKFSRLSGTESIKSFVDDFDMELGIVSARVGLSYDSLRLSLRSGDLYHYANQRGWISILPKVSRHIYLDAHHIHHHIHSHHIVNYNLYHHEVVVGRPTAVIHPLKLLFCLFVCLLLYHHSSSKVCLPNHTTIK